MCVCIRMCACVCACLFVCAVCIASVCVCVCLNTFSMILTLSKLGGILETMCFNFSQYQARKYIEIRYFSAKCAWSE